MLKDVPDPADLPLVSQGTLRGIAEKHARFLKGESGGARAVLQYYNLSGLDFHGMNFTQADFTASILAGSDLSEANFANAIFFACDLRNANLFRSNLSRCDFRGAYMAGANMEQANLFDADLRAGKIMKRGEQGVLMDRKRSAGEGAKTILTGAKLSGTRMERIQAAQVDFSDADLSGASLVQADLNGASFANTNLADADLTETDLKNANLKGSIISGANIARAIVKDIDLSQTISEREMGRKLARLGKTLPELLDEHTLWVSSAGKQGRQLDLSGYDLRDVINLRSYPLTAVKAQKANFLRQDLSGSEMQSALFDHADFRDCNLEGADLRGSSFKYARLARANLNGVQICPLLFEKEDGSQRTQRCDFSGASLIYAHLSDSDLRDGIFMGADLSGAIIQNADLRRADFTGAILTGTVFENVKLDGAIIDFPA